MTTGTSNPPVRQVAGPVPHVSATRPTQLQPTILVPRAQTYRLDVPRLRRVGEVGWTWRQVQRRTSPGGAGARHMGDVPLRRIAGAAQDSVPAIVFYRQSGLVEYPRDRSICWSAQLVRLEPAGHIPIYERGHEVSARIALFPDELQQSQSGWKNLAGSARKGGSVTQPRRCVTLYLDVRFHSASPLPLQLT